MKLKPCPFCGGEAVVDCAAFDMDVDQWVVCDSCGASSRGHEDAEETIAAWNTRVEPPKGEENEQRK